MMAEQGALHGSIVTELGGRLGAAVCGTLLSQLGASVVVVEGGPSDKAAHRAQLAAGKLSLCRESQGLLQRLLARSDVVLTSSDVDPPIDLPDPDAPGGPVLCDITAFGTMGAFAGKPWSDLQVQAISGLCDTTGFADGPPVRIGLPITDYLAGTYAAGAVLAALRVRRLCGQGQRIDMALFDAAFVALNSFLGGVLTGRGTNRSRLGNRHPTVAPWNLYRARDGWVLICAGNQGQWQRLCDLIGRPDYAYLTQADRIARVVEIDGVISAWTATLSIADCIAELVKAKIACGPIAPIAGYPREANLDYRDMIHRLVDPRTGQAVFVPGSPLRLSRTPGQAPMRIPEVDGDRAEIERLVATPVPTPAVGQMPRRPLEGLRIIEIGQYTTAPLCARHLAHLGAEVIKVEQPGGDESRTWVPHQNGQSISFRLNNSDKRSLALNLRSAEGAAVLARLVSTADALVENLKPGTLAKFGFPPSRLAELNPKLVYCAITGFGSDSIYADRPAFDMIVQAMSGFMTALAPSGMPLKSGISTADTMGAEMAIVALLAALEEAAQSGKGQYIDLSMQDVCAWLTQTAWNGAPRRDATVVAVADGYVLAEAPDAVANAALRAAAAMTRDEASAALTAAGIPASPVLPVRESAALVHTQDRRLWRLVDDGALRWPVLACPLRLDRTPPLFSHLSPDVNADGPAIVAGLM